MQWTAASTSFSSLSSGQLPGADTRSACGGGWTTVMLIVSQASSGGSTSDDSCEQLRVHLGGTEWVSQSPSRSKQVLLMVCVCVLSPM